MRSPVLLAMFSAVSAIALGLLVWLIVHPMLVAVTAALNVVP